MKQKFIKCIIIVIITSLPLALFARNGTIQGTIINSATGEILIGANVSILGTTLGAATTTDGTFEILDVPAGSYGLKVTYSGFQPFLENIDVIEDAVVAITCNMIPKVLTREKIMITANRATERETPVAFTNLSANELSKYHTTGDLPDLIKHVPGVYTSTAGLGESEIWVRGFEADKVQILVNGIPLNDPESQGVCWSNWSGIASNISSIQLQRGIGSSLYGSGAFGGSINIETMGVSPTKEFAIRSSAGFFSTQGVADGARQGRVADGKGGFSTYNPLNYNMSFRYNSGILYNGKLNFSVLFERKAGDSYIDGTRYDGYTFGLEAQSKFPNHLLHLSIIGAPQTHHQALTFQDVELITKLGREYNRHNHPYQKNYYFKPHISLRHEWTISAQQTLLTNAFVTLGRGGNTYLKNDYFDVNTGKVDFKEINQSLDTEYFGRHARFIYENTGVILSGYEPTTKTYNGQFISKTQNLLTDANEHSWKNDSHNDHVQFGMNTCYQRRLNDIVKFLVGAEGIYWLADHYAYSWNFRSNDEKGDLLVWHQVQNRYDYDSNVLNLSGFGRATIQPIARLTIQLDGQLARCHSQIIENPVEIFDFGIGEFIGKSYRTTMDLKKADGSALFQDSDYERTFSYFSPKVGANYNLNDELNLMVNYSIGYKEPLSYQWYNQDHGPAVDRPIANELKPEQLNSIEFGVGYRSALIAMTLNYYHSSYKDKIETVQNFQGAATTVNAGKATYQGIEWAINGQFGKLDYLGAVSLARNRWKNMNVEELFGADASDVIDKVVPFSPEKMANASFGYHFGRLRLGFGLNWWDDYYATYTNTYSKSDGSIVAARLPYFFDLSANISFPIEIGTNQLRIRLDLNNMTNRNDNYLRAIYAKDDNRNDYLAGKYHWYVLQAPLIHIFLTTELTF